MRKRITLGIPLTVAAFLAFKVALVAPPPRPASRSFHGAYHVHSSLSDGRGSVAEIADAAHAAGLDFVILTDHNRLDPGFAGVLHGVLIVPATEESTDVGHVVSLGASGPLTGVKDHPLAGIRRLGGAPILAHPLNRKMPFTDWAEASQAAGMEVLSFDDLWRDAVHSPFSRGLLSGALELPLNGRLAMAQLLRRPDAALARWDALRKQAPLVQLCALDAHGWPGYETAFRTMSIYLDEEPTDVPRQGPLVLAELAMGHVYCGVDAIAPADGFQFVAKDHGAERLPPLKEGMEGLVGSDRELAITLPDSAPPHSTIHVFHNGVAEPVATGRRLSIPAVAPGDWRVEVWAPIPGVLFDGPDAPWILSNVIRLQ